MALLFAITPAFLPAATNAIISNLANPAIGFNALMLAQAAPDLKQPSGLQFQESELSLLSVVDPLWTLSANLVFAPEEVTPEEVYASSTALPDITVKLGRFKAAFGKHGQLHRHAWPFVQSPYVLSNTIGEEGFGGMGLEAAWMTPLPWYAELTLGAYEPHATALDQPLDFGSTDQANVPVLGHLKQLWDLNDETTMELGASALEGLGADGLHRAVLGADLTVRWVPLRASNQRGAILSAEYLHRLAYDQPGSAASESSGEFAFLQWRWAQAWWSGVRVEQALNATSEVLVDSSGAQVPGTLQRASANLTWTPSEFSSFRLEGSLARGDDGNGLTAQDRRLMLQGNFTIGYHPAHAY
jgi:hypothetical protein